MTAATTVKEPRALQPNPRVLRVLLVDPSLFTGPYDAALTEGLLTVGVAPMWVTRAARPGERQEIQPRYTDPFFYRHVEQMTGWLTKLKPLAKGAAHIVGLARLVWKVIRSRPDVVHIQWVVVPPLDTVAIMLIKYFCPVVLTVHDTVPFNGERISIWQNAGFDLPIRLAHRVIVHTSSGRTTLMGRGVPADKIAVIPHGALSLHAALPARTSKNLERFTFVLFGEIKPYKGLDVLLDALALVPDEQLAQARVIVAGRPRMSMEPIEERISSLGLASVVELRPHRQSEEEMAALFAEADCFLFPYRQIDASGVWFLTKSLGKWAIASRVGIFATDLVEGVQGALVPPGDAVALSNEIQMALVARPKGLAFSAGDEWAAIGAATRLVYESLLPLPRNLQVASENTK